LGLAQVGARFIQLSQGFAAEFAAGLVDLALHFVDGRLGAGMARVVPSSIPRVSTSERLRRSTSTGETAPCWTSGSDMPISWRSRLRLLRYWSCLAPNSRSSCWRCSSCCCSRRFRPQLLASAQVQRLFVRSLVGRGFARCFGNVQRAIFDFGAEALDAQFHGHAVGFGFADVGGKTVSSRRTSGAPASTICPSCTKIWATMPPSRFWIFWMREEDRLAFAFGHFVDDRKVAQSMRNTKKPITPQMVRRTMRGASSIRAF
jgi:hypothetical protein